MFTRMNATSVYLSILPYIYVRSSQTSSGGRLKIKQAFSYCALF